MLQVTILSVSIWEMQPVSHPIQQAPFAALKSCVPTFTASQPVKRSNSFNFMTKQRKKGRKGIGSINLVISSWKALHLLRSSAFTRHQKDKMLEQRLFDRMPSGLQGVWRRSERYIERGKRHSFAEKSSHSEKTDCGIKQISCPLKKDVQAVNLSVPDMSSRF